MTPLHLPRAVLVSAVVHLAGVAALVAVTHPRVPSRPPMRVSLLGAPAAAAGARGVDVDAPGGPAPRVAARSAAARGVPHLRLAESERPRGREDGPPASARPITPVREDPAVLGPGLAGIPSPAPSSPNPGEASEGGTAGGSAAEATPTAGVAADGQGGTGGSGGGALLAALSQRLAWSAARCAPARVVRIARRTVPGVPLHFCLDAAGRPSGVGLLGTTGSEVFDRAARECVVDGALPLPPAPGCYTVEVRFPVRD